MQGERRFRIIWIWILFVGFVLFLLSTNPGQRPAWNTIEELFVEFTAPFQRFMKLSVNVTEELWLDYFRLVDVRQENKALKKRIDALNREVSRYRELLATHERLRELLQFKAKIDQPVVAAQVTGLDPTGWFKSIIIDKGERAGLKLDMPVVNASGVVGRIVSVSSNYAKVLLIIDQNSAVDCLVQRSRDRGMVKGLSIVTCKLDYMLKSSDVEVDDVVVTSGLGGVYPKGLPVGRVSDVRGVPGELFKEIQVIPSVDFSRLEEVLVILGEGKSRNRLKTNS